MVIAYIYHRIVIFHRAKNVEAAEFPLPTFAREDGRCLNCTVYGSSLVVGEFNGFLVWNRQIGLG